jgi:hypothetical protein
VTDLVETYAQALRDELEHLWNDLVEGYRMSRATPPEQSMECLGLVERIKTITKLVGPLPAEKITMPFLLTGMYERVHAEIGIDASVPPKILQRAREYVTAGERTTR